MFPDGPLHPYVEFVFAADPILASERGDERGHARLGNIEPDAIAEQDRTREALLAKAEAQPPLPVGTTEWLEHEVLLTELRTSVRRHAVERRTGRGRSRWRQHIPGHRRVGLRRAMADRAPSCRRVLTERRHIRVG